MPENYENIKDKYLSEVLNYDEDKYREEIRNKANEYGVKYKENYNVDNNNFGTAGKKSNKKVIIISIILILIAGGTGTFFYFKKHKKNGKTTK